jgi:hypothetical protein
MGSASGTSKGHAKSRRWDLYGVEAYRVAKNSKARRASDDRSESNDHKPELFFFKEGSALWVT